MKSLGKMVLVEDDEGLNQAIARLLRLAGFDPLTFLSAEALLATDAASHAKFLVIDVHLPGISGLELHRQLLRNGHLCPVIFMTAHDETRLREEACRVGQCLIKPFLGQSLLRLVESTLNDSRPQT